jgi:DNA-binding transcriptional ArsR family regulator
VARVIEVKLSVDTLGQTRFGYSPLAEVCFSIQALSTAKADHHLRPWLREVGERVKTVDLALLQAVQPPGNVMPGFLYPWSSDPNVTIEQQLASIAEMPIDDLWKDLEAIWPSGRTPSALCQLGRSGARAGGRLAEVLWEYWTVAVEPYWPRIRAVIEDDVSYRAGRVLSGGLFDLLSELHPEVTLGDRVLRVNEPQRSDVTYCHARLMLIPSVFVWPHLRFAHHASGRFDIAFAARGVGRVWEGLSGHRSRRSESDAIAALLGRTRAVILGRLSLPMTTTQLACELDQSPSTISAHLSVLRACGLLTSWRSGRNVLYRRTPLATSIISAGGAETSDAQQAGCVCAALPSTLQ